MPISKPQRKLAKILESIYGTGIKMNYRGFDWLRTDLGRKQEIDIWIPSIKLAIEYDGEQHFWPIKFGCMSDQEAEKRFSRIVKLDRMKSLNAMHNKDVKYFIRFNYKDSLTRDSVIEKLKTMMVRMSTDWNMDDWLDNLFNPSPKIELIDYEIIC